MKKFHKEQGEPQENYNDYLGLKTQDFDPKDLMDVNSGYSEVKVINSGDISNKNDPQKGKVNCTGY